MNNAHGNSCKNKNGIYIVSYNAYNVLFIAVLSFYEVIIIRNHVLFIVSNCEVPRGSQPWPKLISPLVYFVSYFDIQNVMDHTLLKKFGKNIAMSCFFLSWDIVISSNKRVTGYKKHPPQKLKK